MGRRRVPGAARRAQAAPSAAGGGLFRSCHGCLHPGGVTCRGHRAGRGSSHPTLDHGTCGRGRGTGGGGVSSAPAVWQTVPRSFSPDRSVSGGRWRADTLRAVPRTGTGDTAHPALRSQTSGQGAGVGVPLDTVSTVRGGVRCGVASRPAHVRRGPDVGRRFAVIVRGQPLEAAAAAGAPGTRASVLGKASAKPNRV